MAGLHEREVFGLQIELRAGPRDHLLDSLAGERDDADARRVCPSLKCSLDLLDQTVGLAAAWWSKKKF